MTLPSATALQIESRQPTTAEILAYAASRTNKWFSPQREAPKQIEPVEHPSAPVRITAPPKRLWTVQHDSHMAAYYEWKGNEPLGFLKLRCREMGVNYADIVGPSVKVIHTTPRSALIVEIRLRYPALSLVQIGSLFGDRDHTSIRTCLIKHGVMDARKTTPARSDCGRSSSPDTGSWQS